MPGNPAQIGLLEPKPATIMKYVAHLCVNEYRNGMTPRQCQVTRHRPRVHVDQGAPHAAAAAPRPQRHRRQSVQQIGNGVRERHRLRHRRPRRQDQVGRGRRFIPTQSNENVLCNLFFASFSVSRGESGEADEEDENPECHLIIHYLANETFTYHHDS